MYACEFSHAVISAFHTLSTTAAGAGSHFSRFSNDNDAVILLQPGSRATISLTTFFNNDVVTDKPDAIAMGPVMGLYAGPGMEGAAAWFQNCEFGSSSSRVPGEVLQERDGGKPKRGASGEVAVENRSCRVYSDTGRPRVWDRELGLTVRAWNVTLNVVPDGMLVQPTTFADVESSSGTAFLRPGDKTIQRILDDESISTTLEKVVIESLSEGTYYVGSDPYDRLFNAGRSDRDAVSASTDIILIAGLCSGSVLCVLTALAGWCIKNRKRLKDASVSKMPSRVPTASSIPSALATNSHWATELGDTFMGTICDPDVPPPGAGAPAAKKLEFVHAQLNGIAKDAIIFERFTLLGPNQRRQGGTHPLLLSLARMAVKENGSINIHVTGPRQLCKAAKECAKLGLC